jgi:hypothetical protein
VGDVTAANTHELEEGDEWECGECNEREDAREAAGG